VFVSKKSFFIIAFSSYNEVKAYEAPYGVLFFGKARVSISETVFHHYMRDQICWGICSWQALPTNICEQQGALPAWSSICE